MANEVVGINRDDLYLQREVRKIILVDEQGNPVTPGESTPANVPPMFIPSFDPAKDGIIFMDRGLLYNDPAQLGSIVIRIYPDVANGLRAYFASTVDYTAKFGGALDVSPYKVPAFRSNYTHTCRSQASYYLKGFTEFTTSTASDFAFGASTSVTLGHDLNIDGIVFSNVPFTDLDGNILRPADPSTSIIKTR